ncbi:metallophosphoesterase family protein [Bremerella sp. JC817]|uniref:metallophosphoesterase family protein n=1 Tax=Bremerella sp. JC817 TaxID=3231756 RepID=UPI00345771B5
MKLSRRIWLKLSSAFAWTGPAALAQAEDATATTAAPIDPAKPFGDEFKQLDSLAVGNWWEKKPKGKNIPPSLIVPRNEVVAFVVYTQANGVLKMTAQLFPLKPDEARVARLEVQKDGEWTEIAREEVLFPGWSAHFRVEDWDGTKTVPYRVRHGNDAMFEGTIRRDPVDKNEIVVANMSCNSSRTTGERHEIVENLLHQDPDLLFFAGDQTYRHTEHTAGWIEFGLQFRDVLKDRPTICTPDDHDVGQPNLWGENGRLSTLAGNADGGFMYPAEYVNMVQRQQSWHLPDSPDPATIERGITVYFTSMKVGGVDFCILEDRKFKSGPAGKIPQMGPRPDHINDPKYDPASIDLPGLVLLGERQLKFLKDWGQDWSDVDMKCVLSQTAFCGAVHMHGSETGRLLADLDCNGWPQTGRRKALEEIRRAKAIHLCGDQHLSVVVKHGIDHFGDGPFGFTSPALVNTIYGRWWHPEDEKPGPNPVPDSPLPWTGDFKDGLGNKISMMAYANPPNIKDEKQRADGYGLVRFNKQSQQVTLECWPRFSDAKKGNSEQFPGWPITVAVADYDGRKPVGFLPELRFPEGTNPVVQVVHDNTGDVLYTQRIHGTSFRPPVYAEGTHTVQLGQTQINETTLASLAITEDATPIEVAFA